MVELELQSTSFDIWGTKYQLKNKRAEPVDLSIHDMRSRVARELAKNEDNPEYWYDEFMQAQEDGATPAGRILSNAGAGIHKPKTSLINCTVSEAVRDSMEGIMHSCTASAITLASGAGIGYEFSTLRPKGAFVGGAGSYTSGPLPFMDIFDTMCFTVSSAGGRRGAQMGTMSCFGDTTEVLTDQGWMNVADVVHLALRGKQLFQVTQTGNYLIKNPVCMPPSQLYRVELENGATVEATADHQFVVQDPSTYLTHLCALKDIDHEQGSLVTVLDGIASVSKIKAVTPTRVAPSYDYEVEEEHRIIARTVGTRIAFYTSNCSHPDVEEFIKAKREDGRLRQFNLSLLIDDEFMDAVKADLEWKLIFPVLPNDIMTDIETVWKPLFWDEAYCKEMGYRVEDGKVWCKVYKTIQARDLWDTIMLSTYNFAEPGFLLIDKINRYNNNYFCENIRATNPCLSGDTVINTSVGNLTIREVTDRFNNGEQISVASYDVEAGARVMKPISLAELTKHDAPTIRLTFDNGKQIICTPDHRLYTTNRGYVEAQELTDLDDVVTD
jgi:ribonucleotide reductase alpha subunit